MSVAVSITRNGKDDLSRLFRPLLLREEFIGWAMPCIIVPMRPAGGRQYHCALYSADFSPGEQISPDHTVVSLDLTVCLVLNMAYYERAPLWLYRKIAALNPEVARRNPISGETSLETRRRLQAGVRKWPDHHVQEEIASLRWLLARPDADPIFFAGRMVRLGRVLAEAARREREQS